MSKKHRIAIAASSFLLMAALMSLGFAQMRNITTQQLVRDMGLGVNLGNTFESSGGNTTNFETQWGSPRITREIIAVYPKAGFKTVRVPVRWTNLMTGNTSGGTYTINPAMLDRVEEVVGWILDEGMYVILNIHHEDWIRNENAGMARDSAETMRKYLRIWEQVAERFKGYGDKLMFEGLNEEGVWNHVWYVWDSATQNNMTLKARAYGFLRTLNQGFVNLVRASGGNNDRRHLLVSGYDVNIDRTIDSYFQMPNDPAGRLAVSIHYYDPFCFTHGRPTDNWDWCGGVTTQWGSQAERNSLNNDMNRLKTNFVDKDIPVIVGEYGVAWEGRIIPQDRVREYTLAVAEAIYSRGMLPVLWDTQLNPNNGEPIYYFNRRTPAYPDQQLVAGFLNIAGANTLSVSGGKTARAQIAAERPHITVNGRTLNVSTSANTDLKVRMIDVTGRVRATFNAVDGNGKFAVGRMPAGRYLVDVRGAGISKTTAVVLK